MIIINDIAVNLEPLDKKELQEVTDIINNYISKLKVLDEEYNFKVNFDEDSNKIQNLLDKYMLLKINTT